MVVAQTRLQARRSYMGSESSNEWIQMIFDKPQTVERLGLFWVSYDQVDVPADWRIEYLLDGNWYPLKNISDTCRSRRFSTRSPSSRADLWGTAYQHRSASGSQSGCLIRR